MSFTREQIPAALKVGFLGSGQLARMSAIKAFELGVQVVSYSDRQGVEPLENLTPLQFKGSFDTVEDMLDFAKACDVITLENEFIDSSILEELEKKSGKPLYPTSKSFALIENKLIEKQTFENAGIPVCPYTLVNSKEDMAAFGEKHGWPYLLKSSKGGYDGYGNKTVHNIEQAWEGFCALGGDKGHDILAEAFVPFDMELAVSVARNSTGIAVYPCVQTIQENHICTKVVAEAPISEELRKKAQDLAVKATEAIDGIGVFAFEFFLTKNGDILLNESAPRPHNSAHYSIEACVTSQFENHVRAVMGLPLGSTALRKPAAVMVNLLGTRKGVSSLDEALNAIKAEDGHIHMYGKLDSKAGRKMGHFTLLGEDGSQLLEKAIALTKGIEI